MTITKSLKVAALTAAVALASTSAPALAKDFNISIWSGGSNQNDSYRVEAIEMAADILEREAAIRGEELNIKVESKLHNDGWDNFKQAITLAAESKTAPNIIVTSHADIAPWSQSGLIRPIEDYVDMDAWPLNQLYPNLVEITSYNDQVWGIPQDAESRPFFFWIPHMKAIGYTDEQIAELPAKVKSGEYTLYNVLEDAKKIQDKGLVAKGKGFSPRVSNGPDYWQFYQSFGGVMKDKESGKLVFDKQAMTDMFQFFADAVKMGVTSKTHLGGDWSQWYSEVANGKAGTWHGGTWHYKRYTGKEGLDDFFGNIQFTLIPAGNKKGRANTITHPLTYLVSNTGNDEVAEIAAQLVAIASEPRLNSLHAIKSAHLGIGTEQSKVELYANDRWASEATERLLTSANAMPNHTKFGQYWQIMFKGLESAWTGQKPVADAVNNVEAELKSTLGDDIIVK
ncbi:extracellular solute-binding protein [Cohaesibacter gelatinilyticus]|uniref:Carbohydrate ABC transporter substrate-binding protein, CUT1 family n=1 Tax=Cohaesibacter gelatinilyticus TaxID=372072 RepID=A0A285N757_9HYPH|nr:extracellular solute-binding protein [Cohaesibacter gelatinilyticus]SNZ05305.1 carbohydrate ABC transporter substrate-binding protein, CUT1 family [Cohaesibacter gelatinilyticus]